MEPGKETEPWEGEDVHSAERLDPRAYDQVLYQLGNEGNHAFMTRMIRAVGGTVMQHDWVLFDMAVNAFPGLVRGGLKGHLLALREGGLAQGKVYLRNWLDRRQQRQRAEPLHDHEDLVGTILSGWHESEPSGRWTADVALFRLPGEGVREVSVEVFADGGRRVELGVVEPAGTGATARHDEGGEGALELDLAGLSEPVLLLGTEGITVTTEQRSHGDSRRLGALVRRVAWRDDEGRHELDLTTPARRPIRPIGLSRDRFELPFNRSVVRFADAFLVHSQYVRQRILQDRNSLTPVGVVHHGAEFRWREGDRREARAAAGLPASWRDDFLLVSFGGVQPHKRIGRVMKAVARAHRERADIRLVLAGGFNREEFDPHALADALHIADSVHVTGFVPEELAWDLIHAGDVSVNLRGPTSGGTSGGIFQSFGLGRAVIATDAAEQSELPDACVLKVPLGGTETDELARHLVRLRDDPDELRGLERNVRKFVEDECHWGICARRYFEHMERFPVARAARKSLIAMRLGLDSQARSAS